MKCCDLCGKRDCYTEDLLDRYRTDDIIDICSDCRKVVNEHLDKIRALSRKFEENAVKAFLMNLREKLWKSK